MTDREHGTLTAAAAVEGACLLAALACRLAGAFLTELWLTNRLPGAAAWWLLPPAVLQGVWLSPLRLGRQAFYWGRPFFIGWKRWWSAVVWRWQLWWRRAVALCAALLPAALLWSAGDRVSRAGGGSALLWLLAGAAVSVPGLIGAAVWQCRYAPAPLLILQGYPAGAAMQMAARAMRRHVGEYLNFLSRWVVPMASCLLLVPAVWVLPRFRRARTAELARWLPAGAAAHPVKWQ